MAMPLSISDMIDERNKIIFDPAKKWNHDAILRDGFWGMNCSNDGEAFDSPLSQSDMIRMWGLSKWIVRQRAATSRL